MRHAIGGFRGLDEEFANTADIIPRRIVSLRAHQFCRVEIHLVSLLAGHRVFPTSFTAELIPATKNPRTEEPRPRASTSHKWTYL